MNTVKQINYTPETIKCYCNSIAKLNNCILDVNQCISKGVDLLIRDEPYRFQFFAQRLEIIEKLFRDVAVDLFREDNWMRHVIDAQLYNDKQNYSQAMSCFQSAVQIIPDDPLSNVNYQPYVSQGGTNSIESQKAAFIPSNNRSEGLGYSSQLKGIANTGKNILYLSDVLHTRFVSIEVSGQSEIAAYSYSVTRLSKVCERVNDIFVKIEKEQVWMTFIQKGQAFHIAKNDRLAQEQFNYAIYAEPQDPLAYYWRGTVTLRSSPLSAREDFEFAVGKIPQDFELHRMLAIMCYHSADATAALQHLTDGIQFSDLGCRIARGELYLKLGRLDNAIQDFKVARSEAPEYRWPEIDELYSRAIFKKYSVVGAPTFNLPAITQTFPGMV